MAEAKVAQGGGQSRHDAGAGRPADGNRTDRDPGLPDPRRAGRGRGARRSRCCPSSISAISGCGFDLREDLVRGLKVGDRIRGPRFRRSAIARSTAEVRLIAAKGEYAGWRATRATGDFDLRTFAIRAYPIEQDRGSAAGHERLCRLAERPANEAAAAPRAGAGRDARVCVGSVRDRVALFADDRRPADRLRRSRPGRSAARSCAGSISSVVDADRTPTSRASSSRRSRPRPASRVTQPRRGSRRPPPGRSAPARRSRAVYIPPNFERDLLAGRRPQIVAFYNTQFLTPGNIAVKGLRDAITDAVAPPSPRA